MNDKDAQIVRDSIDVIVSNIPGLGIPWGLSKALYGAGLKLRQQRALEWVEMVRDNPLLFTREILNDESLQDGFVYSLEQYLIERNEEKRKYFRNIFLGFVQSNKKSEFELEKFFHTLSQLDEGDIYVLGYVDTRATGSYQVFDDSRCIANVYSLVNAGILYLDPDTRIGPIGSPYTYTSDFGRRFIRYLRGPK